MAPTAPATTAGFGPRFKEIPMLALNLLGTKEIIVYVVVIVLIVAGWFVLQGRSRR
jgi:hypothetical protein